MGFSATSLTFASTATGATSAQQALTVTNTGGSPLVFTSIALTGVNATDFTGSTNCPVTLAANASCLVNLAFRPKATGARTAVVQFTDNAAGAPQLVNLAGTGLAKGVVK